MNNEDEIQAALALLGRPDYLVASGVRSTFLRDRFIQRELVDLLRVTASAWIAFPNGPNFCRICGNSSRQPHAETCELMALVRAINGETQ